MTVTKRVGNVALPRDFVARLAAIEGASGAIPEETIGAVSLVVPGLIEAMWEHAEARRRAAVRLTCGVIASLSVCVTTAILATEWLPIVCAVSVFWLVVTDWREDGEG